MSQDPRVDQAVTQLQQGDAQGAQQLFAEIAAEDRTQPDALFGLGALAYREGDYETAIRHWSLLVAQHPGAHDVDTWLVLAQRGLSASRSETGPEPTTTPKKAAKPKIADPFSDDVLSGADEAPSSRTPSIFDENTDPFAEPTESKPSKPKRDDDFDLDRPPPKAEEKSVRQTPSLVDDIEEPNETSLGSKILGALMAVGALSLTGYFVYAMFFTKPLSEDEQVLTQGPQVACEHVLDLIQAYATGSQPGLKHGRVLNCFTEDDKEWFKRKFMLMATGGLDSDRMHAVMMQLGQSGGGGTTLHRENAFKNMVKVIPGPNWLRTEVMEQDDRKAKLKVVERETNERSGEEALTEHTVYMMKEDGVWKGHLLFGAREYYDRQG